MFCPVERCGRPYTLSIEGQGQSILSFEEVEQVLVDIIWDGIWKGMSATWVNLQATVLKEFDGFVGTGDDGNGLIVVSELNVSHLRVSSCSRLWKQPTHG